MSIEKNKCSFAEGNIKVICRFRPLSDNEREAGAESFIKLPNDVEENCISIGAKSYSFDNVFYSSASQENVYKAAGEPLVNDVLEGYNGTLFAYGQTSSGKTHSMEGIIGDAVEQGIIPRAVNEIFDRIHNMEEHFEFRIKVSYYEIYMEKIYDLLDVSKVNLQIHENRNRKPYVKDVTERYVSSPQEVFDIIEEGRSNRHVSLTNMNKFSSRSHSIFSIGVKQKNLLDQRQLSGTLYFLDLAGSEKVSKTGADGVVLNEAKIINKSLSALGNVISALSDGKKIHIPYRDSKLTRILQESLGGNARTAILLCCSPASVSESETKYTLEFGRRAKIVKNVAYIDEIFAAEKWKILYERKKCQMRELENELIRWRNGELVTIDEQVTFMDSMQSSISEIKNGSIDKLGSISSLSSVSDRTYLKETDESLQQIYYKNEQLINSNRSLKQEVLQKEDIITSLKDENTVLKHELDLTKEEVERIMQALEDLAFDYDEKCAEIFAKEESIKDLTKKLQYTQSTHNNCLKKIENMNTMIENINEMMNHLSKELTDVTQIMSVECTFSDSGTKSTVSLNEIANTEGNKTLDLVYLNKKLSQLARDEFSLKLLDDDLKQTVTEEQNELRKQNGGIKGMLTIVGTQTKQKIRDFVTKETNNVEAKDLGEVCQEVIPRNFLNFEKDIANELKRLRQIIAISERIEGIRRDIIHLENHLTKELETFYSNMWNRLNVMKIDQETNDESLFVGNVSQASSIIKPKTSSPVDQTTVHESEIAYSNDDM
uniref:Kinesin-like protein n=1 Tax=Glossina brevipalpis TaxID=37001 RepID=A0A1A9WUB9_9MUSC